MAYVTIATVRGGEGWKTVNLDFNNNRYRILNTSKKDAPIYINGDYRGVVLQYYNFRNLAVGELSIVNGNNTFWLENDSQLYYDIERESIYTPPPNTAPSTPGLFTAPTGTLEIGDTRAFTVGAASDAENNVTAYVWEVSINNGSYTSAGQTTTPTLSYKIPTATSLKMRVKARDSGGLESGYRESSAFTVSKPIYYWSKYDSVAQYTYTDDGSWVGTGEQSVYFEGSAKSYTFFPLANIYQAGSTKWARGEAVKYGDVGYIDDANGIKRYEISDNPGTVSIKNNAFVGTKHHRNNSSSLTGYKKGSIVQSGITAVEGIYPTDGRHSDGFWYVRGSRVNSSIAPPGAFTAPATGKTFKPSEVATITFGASSASAISGYEVDYKYSNGVWVSLPYLNSLTRSLTITTDKAAVTLEIRARAKNTSNVPSDYIYTEAFKIEHNAKPTVTLTSPADHKTLYENDVMSVLGTAFDENPDQSVTVYYQINADARKVLATSVSQTQIPLTKQLRFKGGKLFDGETAISGELSDGASHSLKVWAVDSEGGESEISTRVFYVVKNRAATLTLADFVTRPGLIGTDVVNIAGKVADADNGNVIVKYKIGNGAFVQVYNGPATATPTDFNFDILVSDLADGHNAITVQALDAYNALTQEIITLNKEESVQPLLSAVTFYEITPPNGTADGMQLFIERELGDLVVSADIFMGAPGATEVFKPMTLSSTANLTNGNAEDTFSYQHTEEAAKVVIRINMIRTNATTNKAVKKISGVLT